MQTMTHSTRFTLEAQLIDVARRGEPSGLVEYVYLERLPAMARKLVAMFRESCGAVLDAEDVQQAGAEYMLRRLDLAVAARNPVGFLIHAAQYAMLHYCQEQRGPIRVPCASQWRGAAVPVVKSLDAPLTENRELSLADLLPASDLPLDELVVVREELRALLAEVA